MAELWLKAQSHNEAATDRTDNEGPKVEYRYSSTLSLTSALDGEGGQPHAPATLPPGKTQYALYMRLGGPRASLDGCGKPRLHRDSIPRIVQPVASRYTDAADEGTCTCNKQLRNGIWFVLRSAYRRCTVPQHLVCADINCTDGQLSNNWPSVCLSGRHVDACVHCWKQRCVTWNMLIDGTWLCSAVG